ncbi:hypothetical protein Tco_1060863 [Tanacetum coccineum]
MLNFLLEIGFSSLHNVTIDKIPSKLGRFVVANFNEQTYMLSLDSGDKIEVTHRKIHEILGVPLGGYSLFDLEERPVDHEFLVVAQEVDFLFKVNFLTLFTNTMVKLMTAFSTLVYIDSTKFDRFPVVRTRPTIRNWSYYLMKQRQELELKDHVLEVSELHGEWTEAEGQETKGFTGDSETSKKEDLYKKVKEKISLICQERVLLDEFIRKASLEYPGDGKFLDLHEKYVQLLKNPVSFNVDGNGDNDADDDEDDSDGNEDDEDGNLDNDVGNVDDIGNGDDGGNGDVGGNGGDDGNDEDGGNGDDDDNVVPVFSKDFDKPPSVSDEVSNNNKDVQETVDDTVEETFEEQEDEEHLVVEQAVEENEIMSTPKTYTQWLDRNADFVGEGNVLDQVLENTEVVNAGPITLERMPTRLFKLSPRKRTGDKMHFFPTGCITKSMFDGTLRFDKDKWKSFSDQVKAQFEDNVDGLALNGIDLVKYITKTTSMTILDNSDCGASYDSKYKDVCELLKKLFACHLKLYGHKRHARIAKLNAKIAKLKWKTKANFQDCAIFSMLHMEYFNGGSAATWDCGLVAKSKLQRDMLRRLRFKFATKILLHEVNVHAEKMFDLANAFDKIDSHKKMSINVEENRNRDQHKRS